MSEPITPHDHAEMDDRSRVVLYDAVDGALRTLTRELFGTPESVLSLEEAPPAVQRDVRLARIAAAAMITEYLRTHTIAEGYQAAAVDGAPLTYADLGRAAGISRETATKRWPGAIPDAKPGRPKQQVVVALEGGHPQWDGTTLEFDRDDVYGCDLADVGGLLIIPDGSVPDHLAAQGEGPDWRAHYAPESEDTRTTWVFQGWVPS
ncbi:hypothetical protein [Nocardiopsis sp. NPDC006938]|uniref:hypothetical protein n=1 Tax=Nocardiopsis sp. NPDC006938 TaxID=3364337 RepID=UPI0036C95E49